jgi:hypothetical protein
MSNDPRANPDRVFKGWYRERKQQLEKSLTTTVANGNAVNEPNLFKSTLRNVSFKLMNLIPNVRRDLERDPRREGLYKYTWADCLPFLPNYGGGACFSQV